MVKMLITGGSGRIGSELVRRIEDISTPDDEIYLLQRNNLVNIEHIKDRNARIIRNIEDGGFYDVAIHLAANICPKFSRNPDYEKSFYENNTALTKRVSDKSARVILTSSDHVFVGSSKDYEESNPPDHIDNYYSLTKAGAEEIVREKRGIIIRLQTMLGVKKNFIIDCVYEALDGKKYAPFWNNQYIRPSYFNDFLNVLKKTVNSSEPGTYHVSCEGRALSRAEIANNVLQISKAYGLLYPINLEKLEEESCSNPLFPKRLVLDTSCTKRALGVNFTPVYEALEKHVLATRSRAAFNF